MKDAVGTEILMSDDVLAPVDHGRLEPGRITRFDHVTERAFVRWSDPTVLSANWMSAESIVVTRRGRRGKLVFESKEQDR